MVKLKVKQARVFNHSFTVYSFFPSVVPFPLHLPVPYWVYVAWCDGDSGIV
jgi:hypothetical protein